MKAVILAGGRGTRIAEETGTRPKPMVEVGGRPLLWHIMKTYSDHGVNDFVICLGYRGYMIKEFFTNYFLHSSDVTVDLAKNEISFHDTRSEPWRVTLVDTGEATQTGGRVLRIRPYVEDDEAFFLTYGDGLANVDISAQVAYHRAHGRAATMTVVRPPARFGQAVLDDDNVVVSFEEKPQAASGMISGGYFLLSPEVFQHIEGDESLWEREPLEQLAARRQLVAWQHPGFWHPCDTLRDKELLEEMWQGGDAPWRAPL